MRKPQFLQIGLILVIGVFAVSSAAIFIRLSLEAAGMRGDLISAQAKVAFSFFIAASRLSIASLILLPAWKNWKNEVVGEAYYYAAAAGFCLALHFATWIASLAFTSIAASTTLVTTNPIWVALLSWIWFKEKPTSISVIGIGVALIGSVAIAFGDGSSIGANNSLLGNFLALAGAVMVSLYFLFGREAQRKGLGIGIYSVFAYSTAALILIPLPLLMNISYFGYPQEVYFYILLMAIFSQIIGHTSFNWALRWIEPTFVTLIILFEPVSSSFLGFLFFGEVPSSVVLLGGLVLLLGVAIAVLGRNE